MTCRDASHDRLYPLIATRRDGWSLPGEFYRDDEVYRAEMEAIWRRQWIFVGHDCQIPEAGDYFVVQVDGDSLILIRGDDGDVRAMHNVCRHRGTLICQQDAGKATRLVCPYHQWAYGNDGRLIACRGMQTAVDKHDLGLVPVHLRSIEGMLYICLAEAAPDFDRAQEAMASVARPQGLTSDKAKVATIVDYEVAANWKIVWENNRECYHCNANHPQYVRANYDHYNADDTTDSVRQRMDAEIARSERKWQSSGLAVSHKQTGMTCFPDPDNDIWFSANRTVLADGYVSETMDGRPVSTLMGDYRDTDVGTVRLRTMPNMWLHASCDHAVSTRLLPAGKDKTRVRVIWLVEKNAEEGRDYQLEALMPFWQLTSEQDWELCRAAHQGMTSSGYRPGPLSVFKEYNVDAFFRWYLRSIQL